MERLNNMMNKIQPVYQYVGFRARGELPRLVAAAGELNVKDERVSMDDFATVKEKAPFGQLPCLEVKGAKFAQKVPISVYLAKQCGLYEPTPSTAETQLQRDSVLMLLEDVLEAIVRAYLDRNNNKPESLVTVKDEFLPAKLPYLEKVLSENGSGYYCGSKMTLVDLAAFDVIEHVVDLKGQSYLYNFPMVRANFVKISAIHSLKKYVENRPPHPDGYDF